MTRNTFSVSKDHYDFAHPHDWQTAIWFTLREDAPFDKKRWQFTHNIEYAEPEEYDGLSVLEAAQLCQKSINRYWINSDKEKVDAIVAYLETTNRDDCIAALTRELELMEERRADILNELECLKEQQS